MTKFW